MALRTSTLLVSALLAAAAQAAPQTLAFTFAPLRCTSWNNLVPGGGVGQVNDCGLGSLSGEFTFNDYNNDGHVVLSELMRLNVGGISATRPRCFRPLSKRQRLRLRTGNRPELLGFGRLANQHHHRRVLPVRRARRRQPAGLAFEHEHHDPGGAGTSLRMDPARGRPGMRLAPAPPAQPCGAGVKRREDRSFADPASSAFAGRLGLRIEAVQPAVADEVAVGGPPEQAQPQAHRQFMPHRRDAAA